MNDNLLIDNKSDIFCLNQFNGELGSKIKSICPLLKQFTIHVVNKNKSRFIKESQLRDNDTFGFYLVKDKFQISSTYIEIIIDEKLFQQLCLTESEMMAAIAHEIGHVIMFFREDKENFQGQAEEVCCDSYACKIGLAVSLSSLLSKLINSNLYTKEQSAVMKNRLLFIKPYLWNDFNRV